MSWNNDKPQSPRRITKPEWDEILNSEPFQTFARTFGEYEDFEESLVALRSQCLGAKLKFTGGAGVSGDLFLVHLGICEADLPFTFYRNHDETKLKDVSWHEGGSGFRNASLVPLSVWARWNKLSVGRAEKWLQEQGISIEELPAVRPEKFVRNDVTYSKPRKENATCENATCENAT